MCCACCARGRAPFAQGEEAPIPVGHCPALGGLGDRFVGNYGTAAGTTEERGNHGWNLAELLAACCLYPGSAVSRRRCGKGGEMCAPFGMALPDKGARR